MTLHSKKSSTLEDMMDGYDAGSVIGESPTCLFKFLKYSRIIATILLLIQIIGYLVYVIVFAVIKKDMADIAYPLALIIILSFSELLFAGLVILGGYVIHSVSFLINTAIITTVGVLRSCYVLFFDEESQTTEYVLFSLLGILSVTTMVLYFIIIPLQYASMKKELFLKIGNSKELWRVYLVMSYFKSFIILGFFLAIPTVVGVFIFYHHGEGLHWLILEIINIFLQIIACVLPILMAFWVFIVIKGVAEAYQLAKCICLFLQKSEGDLNPFPIEGHADILILLYIVCSVSVIIDIAVFLLALAFKEYFYTNKYSMVLANLGYVRSNVRNMITKALEGSVKGSSSLFIED